MPYFDLDAFCANIERYKVTVTYVVPPIIVLLVNHPGKSGSPSDCILHALFNNPSYLPKAPEKYNMSSLKTLASGAAPLGEGLALAVHARFLKLGADITVPQGL